jgi:hypothetical protein
VAQQGSHPPRSGRLTEASGRGDPARAGGNTWDDPAYAGDDEEYPPWAGPAVEPRWADHEEREHPAPGSRRRKAAARSRRRSRITWIWGGAAIAVVLIVTALIAGLGGSPRPKTSTGGLVTTYLPGEFRTVPDACTSVTTATLGQYLPGRRRVVAPHSLFGAAQSLCNWTLDAPPVYRVLDVTAQAYAPSGLATGDGSATFAAIDAYQQDLQSMRHPARDTHLPAATITVVPRLGTAAFAAVQVVPARGDATDLVTVVARDRNVVVTALMQGPHGHSGRYGPASIPQLRAGAVAAATDLVSGLH